MFLSRGKKGGSANKKGLGWVSEEIIEMNPKEMDSFSNEMRKEGFELRLRSQTWDVTGRADDRQAHWNQVWCNRENMREIVRSKGVHSTPPKKGHRLNRCRGGLLPSRTPNSTRESIGESDARLLAPDRHRSDSDSVAAEGGSPGGGAVAKAQHQAQGASGQTAGEPTRTRMESRPRAGKRPGGRGRARALREAADVFRMCWAPRR